MQARSQGGQWFLRIEDLDPPREQKGADKLILETLEAFGLYWDGSITYQGQRHHAYRAALRHLEKRNLTYPCSCSRKEIASVTPKAGGSIYPGTCRNGLATAKTTRSIRVKTDSTHIGFEDALQGPFQQVVSRDVGDFVIKRAQGLYAYQLAVVIDDEAAGITEVVRGTDLLDSTPRQIYLQRLLGLRTPNYVHLPVASNSAGDKLSKQTGAKPIDITNPVETLVKVFDFLGQRPDPDLSSANVDEINAWAIDHWRLDAVPRRKWIAV